ncbi:unnamed protein product, partial [Coregonus sp. 'balchen']
ISIGNLRTGTPSLEVTAFIHVHLLSLPISQFSHIRRICSSDASYQKQTTHLTQRFKERGYKDNWVKHANYRVEGLTQLESEKGNFLGQGSGGNYKCGQSAQCSFTYKCNSFTHPRTGQRFKIKGLITCPPIYIGIEMVKMSRRGGDIERKLLQRESFWSHRLNTLSPLGLDLKPFL